MFQENKSGRNGRQRKIPGTEEAILCIYYMTRMEIPFRTELTTSTIITMTIITREKQDTESRRKGKKAKKTGNDYPPVCFTLSQEEIEQFFSS